MKLTIRLPCHEDSTVEIDDCHTIANLKEMISYHDEPQEDILQINDFF